MGRRKRTTKEFVARAKGVHGERYDYADLEYKNDKTNICIICPKHGEFWQRPYNHLSGKGCPECGGNARTGTEGFVKKAFKIHGNKYDYAKVEYRNRSTKVYIACPDHGGFWQAPANHLKGNGCPECGGVARKNTGRFVEKARELHGSEYDYSNVEYSHNKAKICIVCRKHGEFWQTPNKHLMGQGCPRCKESSGEKAIAAALEDLEVTYLREKTFDSMAGLAPGRLLKNDFFLPEYKALVEFDGKQHFEPVDHFGGYPAWANTVERDLIKNKWAAENGYKMIRIAYWDFDKIEEILRLALAI